MKSLFKLFFVLSLLALLISACSVTTAQSATGDGGTSVGSGQAAAPAGVAQDKASGDLTANMPSLEEREKRLDGMNPSIPITNDKTSPKFSATPGPGTQSGPVNSAPIPVPASSKGDGSQTQVNASSENIFQALGNWVSGLLKSIFK